MAQAIDDGIPKLRIEEAAARTQARIDSGQQPVIGVNKYQVDEDHEIEVLKVENSRVRAEQIAKLQQLRAERDEAAVPARAGRTDPRRGRRRRRGDDGLGNNLLALAIDAARAKATVGEISDALEKVYGRHSGRDPYHRRGLPRRSREGAATSASAPRTGREVRRGRRPPAAHPGRQDGPGRPRPRAEGDRHRVRRHRFRRRRGLAVLHARRGGPPGRRQRRARGRGVVAGRRAPHAGARAARRAGRGRAPRHHDRGRRRDPAARLRRAVRGGRRRDLPARHGDRRRRDRPAGRRLARTSWVHELSRRLTDLDSGAEHDDIGPRRGCARGRADLARAITLVESPRPDHRERPSSCWSS